MADMCEHKGFLLIFIYMYANPPPKPSSVFPFELAGEDMKLIHSALINFTSLISKICLIVIYFFNICLYFRHFIYFYLGQVAILLFKSG